jgi:SAM-dependent methyltransferase
MSVCVACGGSSFRRLAPRERLEEECRIRSRFVEGRLTRPARESEVKDLTDFFHTEAAEIAECQTCTLLVRHKYEQPPAQQYSKDEYDWSVVEEEYPDYVNAFRRKESYRELLRTGSRVLEVGSHYGAFLQVAGEWGWRAEGVDVGKDTSAFATSKGFQVHNVELQNAEFPPGAFDGVFVWNCFEQIDDPKPLLLASHRLLKPGGLFVVRTPNGLFYSICEALLQGGKVQGEAAQFLVDAMGYNNLLGFPYLYGHSRGTLERLIEPQGFQTEGWLNSELLTLPVPDKSPQVEQEEQTINSEMRMLANSVLSNSGGTLTGPWIEVWFRRR